MRVPAPLRKTSLAFLVAPLIFGSGTNAMPEVGSAAIGQTVLRIAVSKDGLNFKESDGVFLAGANGPTIAHLKNANLVVVVDYKDADGELTTLSVTRSQNDGKSWSPLRPVSLDAPDPVRLTASRASFVRTPGGELDLFFSSTPIRKQRSSLMMVFSATTRNGLSFHVDRSMRLGLPNSTEAHPMAVAANGRIHLLVERVSKRRRGRAAEAVLEHFVSPDGSAFARIASNRFENLRFVGDVIATGDGYRAYVTTPRGIGSLVSKDLRAWKPEPGIRVPRGWDPAVAKLNDGTYLMVYCAAQPSAPHGGNSLVDATVFHRAGADDWPMEEPLTESETGKDEEPGDADNVGDALREALLPALQSLGNKLAEITTAITGPMDWVVPPEHRDDWWDYWNPDETDGFAPTPDFQTKIDYYSWYSDYLLPDPADNAYDAYAKFIPGLYPNDDDIPPWPKLRNMYTDDSFTGPVGPWKAEDHPDWAQSDDAIQELLDEFRDASLKPDYAIPPHTALDFKEPKTDAERLLSGILLPNLSYHRKISQAALADAWRVDEDGNVSPDRMKTAIETTLRGAAHLNQGQTLVEELVAKSELDNVHDTALRALEQGIFSEDDLEQVLDTLQRVDQPPTDPAKGARAEHGFSMDITQYLFSPPTEDGQPKLNRKRAEEMVSSTISSDEQWVEKLSAMTPDDVYASIDAFDRYYHDLTDQVRVGYPDVRASDIEALAKETIHTSPLTEELLPVLSRVYKLKTRGEATRRATQLAYAVHLYKKRNGRWPASLDDLPERYSADVRADPFTGNDFKYELTDNGPRLYSLSENARDDGGRHSPRWDDHPEDNGGSDDYVFWPPQPKR